MAFVDYSVDGAVAVITINRPPVNALSVAVATEFGVAVDRAADETVRAVVVTGSLTSPQEPTSPSSGARSKQVSAPSSPTPSHW